MMVAIKFNSISLLERIKKAENNDELLALAVEGNGYNFASNKTRHRWEKAGLARKAQFLKGNEESEPKPKSRAKTDKKDNKERKNK